MGNQTYEPARDEPASQEAVVVRLYEAGDWPVLCRLAALDSRPVPRGRVVVGLVDDELVAARSVDAPGDVISDPFRHTAFLLELLELRAGQIREAHRRAEPRPVPRLAIS
jgi:hypothetical protein